MKRFFLLGSALAALITAPAFAQIDPAKITQHVKVLASDEFEGRAPVSPGEEKTVAYIVEQFEAAGLQPGGDMADGRRGWTQDVPLARFAIKGDVAASARAAGRTIALTQGEQIALRATQTGQTAIDVKNLPVVFAGYGVTAPERKWDDFKGMDVKGKLLLVLVNDPDFETGKGDFGGEAMTYYGRWSYKYEEAARRGAAGLLVIHETAPASYGWATVKNSNTNEIYDIIRDDPSKAHSTVEGWIQRDVAAQLMKSAGLDFATLKKQAQSRDFRPAELKGVTFSAAYGVDARKVVTRNILGLLPGAERPDEYVIYSGHWDHLGVGLPDAKGDRIYNGAVDNATGIAVLVELARAFGAAPKPERSVVFAAWTAEEKGLLGSEYYASKPVYPLARTVGVINADALAARGPARDFSTSGDAPLTLQDDLIAAGKARGRYFEPDANPGAGGFYRSDHFPMAKVGVPAISYKSGRDLIDGGKAAGDAQSAAYTSEKYHQPSDEIGPDWRSDGIAADADLLYDLGSRLANSTVWPEWKTGAEFKAERDKTAAQRK